jgi:Do/DeqQ family serine protease
MSKISWKTFVFLFVMSIASLNISCAQQQGGYVDLTYAAERCTGSVVYIKVTTHSKTQMVEYSNPFEDFFSDFFGRGTTPRQQRRIETPKRQGAGSGVILTSDGYIVTNNHVVENADELQVKLNDNREYKARIIGLDKTTDLALIKVEAENLPAIKVGSSDDLKVGEWVLAIGNPFSLTSTVTAGIVSAKARGLGSTGGIESFIQTDAAINPGNSGGALVNARGELVGINAMLYSQTGSFSGYGFAIPVSIMTKVVDDLKKYGTVQRAVLGISGTDVSNWIDLQKEKGKETDLGTVSGVYVNEVTPDGAASEVLKEGDIITSIAGHKIEKMSELQETLAGYHPGDKVEIEYLRDKQKRRTSVVLRNVQGTTTMVEDVEDNNLGAALRPLTTEEKRELNLSYGLVVKALQQGKLQEAGVTKGIILMQVNDRKLNSVADFEETVKAANLSSDRVLWIRAKTQSGLNRSYTVELSDDNKSVKK